MRFALCAFVAAALTIAASPPPPLRVALDVKRPVTDLLAPITISVSVENRSGAVQPAAFTTADLFDLTAHVNNVKVWDARYGQQPLNIVRKVIFDRGRTLVQSNTWDGTTNDKHSLPPGNALLRVTLLTEGHPSAAVPIVFATPLPIAHLDKVKFANEVTIAGDLDNSAGAPAIVDASGSVKLSRRVAQNATGAYVVRGFVNRADGALVFNVTRYAPAFENAAPLATAAPGVAPVPPTPPLSFPTRRPL